MANRPLSHGRNRLRLTNTVFLATTTFLAGFGLIGLPGLAHAGTLPAGGSVAAGSASIASSGANTVITQSSQNAVINWQSFSVGQGNTVTFNDPNAQSATLNRVTGSATSVIAGQIISNGAVYLVNPNGIAITSSGAVQTGGGFVASTLGIADADFMAGRLNFAGNGASQTVSNAGKIIAGQGAYVALLGGAVSNAGTITVPLGRVGLGSGEQVALDLNGSGFMQVAVPTVLVTGSHALVDNSGAIVVSGGRVTLSAAAVKNAVRNFLNVSGSINADSAVGDGGTITLIGGADTADMAGTVTVSGTLSARATGLTGNGGTVETSGATVNLTGAQISTTAAHGKTGSWLIDPTDFTIAASGGDITGAALGQELASNNITIQSSQGASGTSGNINVNDAVSWNANTLTLDAYFNINVNAVMSATGTAGFVGITGDTAQAGIGSASGQLLMGLSGSGFAGVLNLAPTASFQLNGTAYTIITTLGAAGSTTGMDLQGINGNLIGNYVIGANIDASAASQWNYGTGFTPIGEDSSGNLLNTSNGFIASGFMGQFNGLGHKIYNLIINSNFQRVGLFWFAGTSSVISNIGILRASIFGSNSGASSVSSLVGLDFGNVNNAFSTGTVTGTGTNDFIGGLIGASSGSVKTVFSNADVALDDFGSGFGTQIGGLIGENEGILSNAYATGSVTTTGSGNYIGGLVGYNTSEISNSYSTG